MPRKGRVAKRDILPDPKYHSKLVAKFVNSIMWEGKKSVAEQHSIRRFRYHGQEDQRGSP